MSGPLLEIADLRIRRANGQILVDGVDLAVGPGETVAIVGESGSGKSLTTRAVMGLLPKGMSGEGTVRFGGRNLLGLAESELRQLRGREIAMVLQDPFTMLNPLMRAGQHIAESLDGTARTRTEKAAEVARRLGEVGIGEPSVARRYPFQLSGGMRQRVGIAAALAKDPQLVIADEPTTALDVTTQKEILLLLRRLQAARGMGLILITHDLRVAFSMADRVYVLYAGGVMEAAPAGALAAEPLHPYSLGLLLSEPPSDRRLETLEAIPGSVPSPDSVAECCRFSSRCEWATEACRAGAPPLAPSAPERLSACIRVDEIRSEMAARQLEVSSRIAVADTSVGDADHLVVVRSLVKRFGASDDDTALRALDDVTIELSRGESVGIVGESGSGKTTLARCLVGLEQPTSGSIVVDGVEIFPPRRLPAQDRLRVRRAVQMVFQDPYSSLNPSMTLGATLDEALALAPPEAEHRSPEDLLELVGLPARYAKRKPVALSGGERQRVAIARALAVQPKVLICDEAVSALDVSVQAQVLNLLKRLREELELSYLFISHDLAVVRQVVERAYVLYRGKLVEVGPIDRILDAPHDAYTKRLVASTPSPEGDWLAAADVV
ncbi:MAG: dipeptide ABC transporter ATP-binding protein [Conexibacter sp.]